MGLDGTDEGGCDSNSERKASVVYGAGFAAIGGKEDQMFED